MIDIVKKEECTGCSACVDICPKEAIKLEIDNEGFWYPKIDYDLCINCNKCEKTCSVLRIEELETINEMEPVCFGGYNSDDSIRFQSTSGGLFSALANKVFDEGGYVGGAVFDVDFSVKHVVTNNREDLLKIRGSKYLQSFTQGIFIKLKAILDRGEKVLICGAPCQMASLRLFLGRNYDNLIICDYICRCTNSPKVFRKYIDSLERKHGSKVIFGQAKNKELGWRALSFKAEFENGKKYLKDGFHDSFTRGYMTTNCCSRLSCYECKFKQVPRISDITLGDFWGIENIDKSLDNNTGTSAVIINSQKGLEFFNSIDTIVGRKVKLNEILPGNGAILSSLTPPTIDRKSFFEDLDKLTFDKVAKKYFPYKLWMFKNTVKIYLKNNMKFLKPFYILLKNISFYPISLFQFININVLNKNIKVHKGQFIIPKRYTVLNIHKTAKFSIKSPVIMGYKRIKGSKLETRFAIEKNAEFNVSEGGFTVYYGCDILIFEGAKLNLKGRVSFNQNVQIICMENITIGHDVMIARDVVIRDNDGGHEIVVDGYKKTSAVTIGNHVWIGQGAIIMKGVTIGDGSIISAGAWVTTNVKPNSLVMGDPARTIKKNVEWRM